MANIKAGITAITAIVALAFPVSAAGMGGGGMHFGGGGMHFGGGGGMHSFGGGGMHSFGGGAMHSFGGGGMHSFGGGGGFGGGGMHSFGGGGFGGGGMHSFGGAMHFPAPSFARPSFGGGAMHSFARPGFSAGATRSFVFSRGSIAGLHAGSHGFFARRNGLGGVSGNRSAIRATGIHSASAIANARGAWAARAWRTRLGAAGAIATGAVLAHGATHWMNGGHWHDHADWRRHRGFFGWVGPVFWPWFYDDLYDCIFWDYGPYYYEDPFWAYGYGDIYGAIFSPSGYGELTDWAPPRGRVARRNPASEPGTPSQTNDANQPAQPTQWSAMCGDDAREVANLPIERISAAVSPNEQQRAALDALANASVQAAQAIKAACPTDVAFTPTGRLDAMERRVDAMVQAVALIRPPLDSFYGMLSDEQKARFNAIGQGSRERRGAPAPSYTQGCGPNDLVPEWQQARIEKLVRPSEDQHLLLDSLRDATQKAADMLKATCPAEPPASPPARITALATRLDTMLNAVKLVRAPLHDFYNSLSDEQKAQFNRVPPVVQVGRPKG